jgi:hypothetical protein
MLNVEEVYIYEGQIYMKDKNHQALGTETLPLLLHASSKR